MEANYKITNGPSKDRLFDACKYAGNNADKIEVAFAIEQPATGKSVALSAFIRGIEHEDGSGESFIISGALKTKTGNRRFKAYYSSKRRQGVVTSLD